MNKKIKVFQCNGKQQSCFEELVEMLEELVHLKYEKAIKEVADEMSETNRVIALLYPEEQVEITSFERRFDNYVDFDFDEGEVEDEFGLCMGYDSECVVAVPSAPFRRWWAHRSSVSPIISQVFSSC